MIQVQIGSKKFEVEDELEQYIQRKLGRLDRYFPRRHQPTRLHVEILRDEKATPDKRYKLTALLEAPGPDMHAQTRAMNPHSAVDILEAKLKEQIRKYKDKHIPKRLDVKRLVARRINDTAETD